MDLARAVRAFVYVVQCGGFTAAAKKMATSKSVLSKLVSELEKSYGVKLLDRTTRSMKLTAFGEGVFASALKLVTATNDFEARLHAGPSGLGELQAVVAANGGFCPM